MTNNEDIADIEEEKKRNKKMLEESGWTEEEIAEGIAEADKDELEQEKALEELEKIGGIRDSEGSKEMKRDKIAQTPEEFEKMARERGMPEEDIQMNLEAMRKSKEKKPDIKKEDKFKLSSSEELEKIMRANGASEELIKQTLKYYGRKKEGAPKAGKRKPAKKKETPEFEETMTPEEIEEARKQFAEEDEKRKFEEEQKKTEFPKEEQQKAEKPRTSKFRSRVQPLDYDIEVISEDDLDEMDMCAYFGSKGKIVLQKGCVQIKAERW